MKLTDLLNKRIKATYPDKRFVIGTLLSLSETHAEIYDDRQNNSILIPLAQIEIREAW